MNRPKHFKIAYLVSFKSLIDFTALIQTLTRTYSSLLVRFSISFIETDQAALLMELQLKPENNSNKMALALQNSIEMYGLRIDRIHRLFSEDPAFVRKIERKYFARRMDPFVITTWEEAEKVVKEMNGKLKKAKKER
ncbi:MAG: hypothetical protein ACE5HO_17215 [bacterium]